MSQEMSDSSREAMKVTLLGGGWTSSAGGVATFNRELAIHLSQHPKVDVCLLVPDGHCTDEDKSEAKKHGITVVSAKKRPGYDDPLDWLGAPPEGHKMDVVVGHGAKLGRQVQFIKDSARFHNCKWVQVVHTAPEDLSKYKSYSNPIPKGEKKHKVEVELCKLADLVVPIGPRLEEVYSSYLQRYKKDICVFPFIPGLFEREFGGLEQSPNEKAEFKVLLCGRGDVEDFELKGYNLAATTFTDHRLQRKRYSLLFVGAPEGRQEVVRERLLQCGIAKEQLTVRTFAKSRETMKDLLCEVNLAIMPSRSEGFGLVALEALSAGLPILVNSESGFGRALEELPCSDSFIVNSDEPAEWAGAIERVRISHKKRLKEIKLLRTSYGEQYSWKEQCGNFVEKLWTMVHGSSTGSVEIQGADPPVQEKSAAAAPDKGLSGQQPSSDEEEKGFGANEEGEPSGEQSLQKERKRTTSGSTFDLGASTIPSMDPDHCAMFAKRAMQIRNFEEALQFLTMLLVQVPPTAQQRAAPLLLQRAHCFWELGEFEASLQDMTDAIRAGLPDNGQNAETESQHWTNRGYILCQRGDYPLAEMCANVALHFRPSPRKLRAQPFLCRAIARYEMGDTSGTQRDINETKELDLELARDSALLQKDFAIKEFQQKHYEKSMKLLCLALMLHPQNGSDWVKFKRSVESHQAAAYFNMKRYKEALQVGERSHQENPSEKLTDEAKRWKERGNKLSKEPGLVDLAIGYYSLALNYTPSREKELKAAILSNRSLMYKKKGKDEEALKDAKECVKNKPYWAKAQYRLGSCLSACKRFSEAMEPFTKSLELLLKDTSSTENDKVDTLNQLLSVALTQTGGTSGIPYSVPRHVTQKLIDTAIAEKDWERLYLLFMGGGGERRFEKGAGGLGTGCDASGVPVEDVIRCDFPDLSAFVRILLDHKAIGDSQKGGKGPVDVAIELEKFQVASVLMDRNIESGSGLQSNTSKSSRGSQFKAAAEEALLKGDISRATQLLELASKDEYCTVDQRRETLQRLCELYFEQNLFNECLMTGQKLRATYRDQEKEIKQAKQWKTWGNDLHKESKYDLMADYYSLAMEFTPLSSSDIMTALLSNRCLAFIHLKKFNKALADAERCIEIKPQWFRGYSRHGNCLLQLKRHKEAIKAFCKAHTHASNDKEKYTTAGEVVSAAMEGEFEDGGSQIPCAFSPDVLQFLVKEASEKCEWNKLRFLYLGSKSSKTLQGIAFQSGASSVPLNLLIESDIKDLHRLLTLLLERGAPPDGLRGCERPPLLTAMELMKFPLAVTLLRKNADPSCVVGQGIFINREGQPKQWLQLGRKALENNDYKKATMLLNMCVHLSDFSTDVSILTQVYQGLAESHFQQNEHERAIDAGKECFKRRPFKSEEEAQKYQVRASKVFEQGRYSYCKEYVNLALKYTPPDSKSTYSRLLCQRSQAEQHLGEYTNGLEDAKKAAMMTPEMLEGHLNQVSCLRALKRQREAMEAINECLKRTADENLMDRLLGDALDTAVNLEEGTSALTAPVQSHLITKLTSDVIAVKDWNKLRMLYLGGGGSQLLGDGGLATNVDASRVPLGEVIRHFGSRQPQLISALLENGASANRIEGSDFTPLDEAMRQESHQLVEKLVQHGANCCVASSDGEPIVHKALKTSFQRGNFRFLEVMMESKSPEIESVQDSNGDTLYHLVSTGRKSIKQKCNAIRILQNANINPNLPNKSGKRPIDMLYKSDARWKKINNAIKRYGSATSTQAFSEKNQENVSSKEEDEHMSSTEDVKDEDGSVKSGSDPLPAEPSTLPKDVRLKVDEKQRQRNEIKATIQGLINDLSVQSTEAAEETETHDVFDENTVASNIMEQDDNALKKKVILKSTEGRSTRTDVMGDVVTEQEQFADDETDTQIDQSPFEDLPWEVDCTDRVWRAMRSRKVDNNLRRRIIDKIRMLANGRWSKTLCKRLEGEAKKAGIQLYESKLTKGQRIIWEKTIAFSGRLSDTPELRLNTDYPGGRIYTDIIRVWDIVLDHDKLDRAIENIVKSHDRGMDCLIKKNLKGFNVESHSDSPISKICLPNKYAELAELNQVHTPAAKKELLTKPPTSECLSQIFYPPASANDQEYHILKFYTFSTPLVKTVLESDTSARIDFPFKITELEHAIVNLRPDPPTPIILLGRSGTGKTTCCLYRLWDRFQHYWESAVTAGPHIQKYVPPRDNTSRSNEEEENQQRSREGEACGQDRSSASLTSECQEFEACAEHGIASNLAHNGEESQVYSSCSYPPSTQEQQPEQNDAEDVDSLPMYEHLHQIFITKNTVLCNEVEKNFKELCRACPAAEHRLKFEDQPIPTKIQNVHKDQWPLFLNSRDWLLMLDASIPGESFFKRAPDGSLLRKIEGWGEEDNHLQFIPTTELDESDDEEEEELAETGKEEEIPTARGKEQNKERDPRREITYQTFLTELWPKMKKKSKVKIDFHPTLVWTEIRSFIKGSAEALVSEKGILSLEDYESLGKKKAPNFTADRKVVYDLFLVYQRVRSSNRMFDEADLVFNIHQRLQGIPAPEWSVHQFYVDETQDFTQAELSLLIRCCRFPNYLFFTGDTAQSIMRGIAFRFDDLKTLFHHAKEAAGIKTEHHDFIRVPKKLYQLTHNYRSHAGILRLASSVVDLLLDCFPESFDRLQKDEGLFDGPKPVLLESCSPTDLAMILQGNQRQSSRIEFGAHQVVLVVSNEARETMPDELKQGLVMTIYEAKGLEFDDVLIYNFFKDSQAGKEWRVVTSFAENQNPGNVSNTNGIVEITEDNVAINRSRPLKFDPGKHKVLNSEFKYLYTAITRARVNVWFFDEDKEARTPVFDYFRGRDLVKVVALSDKEQGTGKLTSMFAAKSTTEEWQKGGMRFYRKRLWVPAIQCFTFAGDTLMLQKSRAQQLAAEAIKLRYTNRQQMRDEFLKAGESFLQCGMHGEAAICLHNSQEWILLAKLYQKTGKFRDAAKLFKKKGWFNEASRCYESQNNYRDAIETLCIAGHFDEALSALERFNILCSSGDPESRQGIIPPRSTRTIERLRHQLADQHFKRGNTEEMEQVLQYLPSATDRITFLKKRGCIIEAARAMEKAGKRDEAAVLLRDTGRFQEAVRCSSDPKFVADCFISQARTSEDTEDTQRLLGSAIEKYKLCDDLNGQAEAYLMLGKISANVPNIQAAGKLFDKCKNSCGEAESVSELLKATGCSPPPEKFSQWIAVRTLERLLRLVTLLHKPVGQLSLKEQNEIKKCEEHFGLFTTEVPHRRVYFCRHRGRFSKVDPEFVRRHAGKTEAAIDVDEARRKIACTLIDVSVSLQEMVSTMLEKTFCRNSVCREALDGTPCVTLSCDHQLIDSEELFHNRFHALFNFVYLESVVERFNLDISANKRGGDISPLNDKDFKEFNACQRFYNFLFPSRGYRRFCLTLSQGHNIKITKAVNRRIAQFACFLWKGTPQQKRRSDTDNFLKVSSSLQLIGSASDMVRWICEEENEFQRQGRASRVANDQLVKNGMVFQNHSGLCESYLNWWEGGKKRLYVYGDVENAAHLIVRRFLTNLAKRSPMINIYPSIANTVMIIEHQMTACLALYTRLCLEHRYPVCLPASYLTMVRFWDNFRPGVETNTFTMYQAIEHNVSQEQDKRRLTNSVCSILNYMVKFTCGVQARSFDVLGDALASESTPVEEAERTLILILTMLCNCGKAMSRTSEKILLQKIFTLKLNPSLPNRISKVLEGIHGAKGYPDVVALLQKFLQSRGEDLYDLRWHNGKLWQDGPSNPRRYRQEFYADISNIQEEVLDLEKQQSNEEEPQDNDAPGSRYTHLEKADPDVTAGDMEVQYTEEELKGKEEAQKELFATTLQKWYRRIKLAEKICLFAEYLKSRKISRLISIEERMKSKASSDGSEEHFSRFKVDSTACGICGKHFETSTDEHLSIDQAGDEGSNPPAQEITTQDERMESADSHQKSRAHLQKENEFQQYKNFYLAEIHPCLMKEDELLKMVENITSSGEKSRMDSVSLDLERLGECSSTVKKEVQNIESALNWSNTASLWEAAKEFKTELQRTVNVFEQAKTDSLTDEQEEEEEETEEGQDRNEDYEVDKPVMEVNEKKGKTRRKPKKHRKR